MFRVFFLANKDHDGQIVVFIRHMWSLFFKRRWVSWGSAAFVGFQGFLVCYF